MGESQEPYYSLESHLIWNSDSRTFASVCPVKFRHGSKLSRNDACVKGPWFILLDWWSCTRLSHSLPHHSRNISAFHAQMNALIRAKATISKQQAYNLNLHPVRSTFPTAMKMSKCNNCGLSRQGASSCNEMRRHNEGVAQNRSISPLLRKKKVNVVLWRFGGACLANFPSCSLLNIIREEWIIRGKCRYWVSFINLLIKHLFSKCFVWLTCICW